MKRDLGFVGAASSRDELFETDRQKDLVLRRLENRIGKDGIMRVISHQTRSQTKNREPAMGLSLNCCRLH